ncbi:ATP-binding protein [Alkaliphilus transvaalensis]|uniref:ATP-binding protein n=1 Tax=Alkaliphilus transvaalensis TaxID=114628 RepID=UPI00047E2133|nr:ATP-binding protein [Alkaliphilus transvaalensis]
MNKTNKDEIKLSIPNKPEYVSVVRLTVTGIANRMGFNIEEIEDLKVAIAEACSNAITHGHKDDDNFKVSFVIEENKLVVTVCDSGRGCMINDIKNPDLDHLNQEKEGGLGIFIIKSLMDDVKISSSVGCGTTIMMTKYVGVDR